MSINSIQSGVPGTYHLADNPELYEPQRNNNFELQITGIEDLKKVSKSALDSDAGIVNGSDLLRLSVDGTSVPSFSQEVIPISFGNNKIKFAGVPTFNDSTLKVVDYIGAGAKDVLLAWQSLSYNARTQKVGLAKDYKKTAYLIEYTPDYQVVRTWKIIGCWISSLEFDEFSYGSNEKKMVNAKITYDYAYPEE